MSTTLEKSELACRLLDRAIQMLFERDDTLYVMTMAHPAHVILQDLAQAAFPESHGTKLVWQSLTADGYTTTEDGSAIDSFKKFLNVLHKVPNAAKHADAPDETHVTYGAGDAAAIMAAACIHAGQLGVATPNQAIYMLWRLGADGIYGGTSHVAGRAMADLAFPGLAKLSMDQQLQAGLEVIQRWPNVPQASLIRHIQQGMSGIGKSD